MKNNSLEKFYYTKKFKGCPDRPTYYSDLIKEFSLKTFDKEIHQLLRLS